MSTVRGEQALRDLAAAGHGVLADPGRVFGLAGDPFAEPPAWLAEPAEVRLRLAAKPADDGVRAEHWPGVVELARRCAAVAGDVRDDGAAPVELVYRTLTLSNALARRLPRPPVAVVDIGALPPPVADLVERALAGSDADPSTSDRALWTDVLRGRGAHRVGRTDWYLIGHWQDRLRDLACRLAAAVGDRWWTDPDSLAGSVEDVRRILTGYLVTLVALEGPIPRPRPSTGLGRPAHVSSRTGHCGGRAWPVRRLRH